MKSILMVGIMALILTGCTGAGGNTDTVSLPGALAMSGKVEYLETRIPDEDVVSYLNNKRMAEALERAYGIRPARPIIQQRVKSQQAKQEQTTASDLGVEFRYPPTPEYSTDFQDVGGPRPFPEITTGQER